MSHQNLPVSMHPRYQDFLRFMADCPYRKTPSTMETAFWAWLKAETDNMLENMDIAVFGAEQSEKIAMLKADLDRLHRERENFHIQCSTQAEEIERLNAKNADLQAKLDDVILILLGGEIGERGHACMSVDGANL